MMRVIGDSSLIGAVPTREGGGLIFIVTGAFVAGVWLFVIVRSIRRARRPKNQ